jgi:hypothetical protein
MKLRKLSVLILLMLLLASCGGGGDGVELSQSITVEDDSGTLTVKYPEGWVADNAGGAVQFANNQAVLGSYFDELEQGMANGNVTLLDLERWRLEVGATPEDAIAVITSGRGNEELEYSAVDTSKVNGRDAALVTFPFIENGKQINQLAILVDEGGVLIGVLLATPDDIDEYKDIARAIAGQLEFVPN